ncbi:MAG: LysE family translocator [Gammaproteobacteria bacterium]|nr:LysE family translocator [Gammaproteobacteria bacterium]
MSIETWLAFVLATSILLIIPGPTIMLVVSYALSHGRSSGWATVPGVALGDFIAITASLAGAGALMAASTTLFSVVKLLGAAYLIWLGIRLWRSEPEIQELPQTRYNASRRAMFRNAWIVTALNPKGMVFFVAFVPQFVNADAPLLLQFCILVITFVTLAAINVALWAILAGQVRQQINQPSRLRWLNRAGASFMIGAGLVTATFRQ